MNYEIVRHGVENAEYFRGCGIAFDFDRVVTGLGHTEIEAFEDCMDCAAMGEDAPDNGDTIFETERVHMLHDTVCDETECNYRTIDDCSECQGCELHWYVSIRWRARKRS